MKRTATAIALVLPLFAQVPAKATDLLDQSDPMIEQERRTSIWTGPYVSAGVGYEKASVDFEDVEFATDGFFGNGRIGYDQTVDRLLFGGYVEGRYNDLSDGELGWDNEWTWGLGGRLGFILGNTLFYGTGGWAQRDVSIDFDGAPDTVDEWFYGGGIEVHAGGPFFIGAEVRQHLADEDDLADICAECGLDADSFSAMLSVTFKANPF